MAKLTECEARLRHTIDELQLNSQVNAFFTEKGTIAEEIGDVETVFARAAGWYQIPLDPSLQRCFVRFNGISCAWQIERSRMQLSGEFRVRHLLAALVMEPPPMDWGSSEFERQLYSELRVIDDYPQAGTAAFAALRIQPDSSLPEVWYHDFKVGAFKLDLNYCEYLDALTITKGACGWQYLFADVSLSGDEFIEVATDMGAMLEVFPELFPEYDYEPLRARLEARL